MQNKKIKKTELAPKPKQKGYFWLALISLAMFALIYFSAFIFIRNVSEISYTNAQIGNDSYSLEIADTDATRAQGLSERNQLSQNEGMLFDFKEDGNWRIWMNRMRFSIDVAWLDANTQVLYIKNNASPEDFPERYSANQLSRYVVEINAGEFERLGVKPGDYISF